MFFQIPISRKLPQIGLFLFLAVLSFARIQIARAEEPAAPTIREYLEATGTKAQYAVSNTNEYALSVTAGKITFTALTLLGSIFIALIVYAGYLWMTARGKTDEVEKAQEIIKHAVIGLFILFAAYVFTTLVLYAISGLPPASAP